MSNMLELSQSFEMGNGNVEHNFRYCKGRNMRQNGIVERRFINEHIVCDTALLERCKQNRKLDYASEKIKEILLPMVMDRLVEYNEHQVKTKHKGRVITLDDWLDKKSYTRSGKVHKIFSEYIFTAGDMFTACPYEYDTAHGLPLDNDGNVIFPWNTDKRPAYKNGKIKESAIAKKMKSVFKDLTDEFLKRNPNAHAIAGEVHGDEGGAIHYHLDVLWTSKADDTLGIGLGDTSAMREQYERRGIKCNNTRYDNAMTKWQKETRKLWEEVCLRHGIKRLVMDNDEEHKEIEKFMKSNDKRAKMFRRMQEELAEKTMMERKQLELDRKQFDEKVKFLDKYVERIDKREAELAEREKEFELTLKHIGAKPYLLNHYNTLKKHPEMFTAIHNEVMAEFRRDYNNKGKLKANAIEK